MGSGRSTAVLKQFRALFEVGTAGGLTDGQLLERFVRRDAEAEAEAAFEALVARHGPIIRRVCRGILGNRHDAEDASQATFLVLARKAGSIRKSDSVASWLFGVACRVSARAKADAARRAARERRGAEMTTIVVDEGGRPGPWPELYEEVGRLPEKYRAAIVLCHLEGLTYEQAARRLHCPVRTIQSRLARGRERLRGRLARRGVTLSAGLLAAGLAPEVIAAGVACAWKQCTVKAAVRYAAGGPPAATVPAMVAALAHGVLRAIMMDKLKSAAAAAVFLGVVACGMGALARLAPPAPNKPTDRYRVTMDNGTTIEVVGVSTDPSGPKTWWSPDGLPLDEAPADLSPSQISAPDGEVRAILVHVAGLPEGATFKWLPTYDGSYTGVTPTKDGRRAPELEVYVASFHRDRTTCEVRANIASGPWEAEASHDGSGGTSFVKNGRKYYFGKARPYRSGTAIAVAHNIVGRDNRFVAVDHDGKVHPPTYSSGGGAEILSLLDAEFRLPPDQIRAYQVQSRPFERAEIKAIPLRPPFVVGAPKAKGD